MILYLWKEWKEQARGKGLWVAVVTAVLVFAVLVAQARSFPADAAFLAFLLQLYDVNVYLLPLFCLLLAAFSVLAESEQRTLSMLLAKGESYVRFLWKKSAAVQGVLIFAFLSAYGVLALPLKGLLPFQAGAYAVFLFETAALIALFTQIGVLIGSACATRLQAVGAVVGIWFALLFLADLAYFYAMPSVTAENAEIFALLYFLHPLHALGLDLEVALGVFPLRHLSRLMENLFILPPRAWVAINLLVWLPSAFGLAVFLRVRREPT